MEELKAASYDGLKDVFGGLNQYQISRDKLSQGIDITDFLVAETNIFPSNGKARQKLGENAISINKTKVALDYKLTSSDLLHSKMILLQQGKKNYYVVDVL